MTHLILVSVGPGAPPDTGRHQIGPDLALVIGRDASCDIRIDESQDVVSRRHLTIRWDGEELVAHDSSSNGLFVNGQRVVKSQAIHDEDVIQLGANGPVFTVALILGVVWGTQRGAGWDRPEYPLAFVTWVAFAALLLMRTAYGWRGRRSAWLTLVGFGAALLVLLVYLLRRVGG